MLEKSHLIRFKPTKRKPFQIQKNLKSPDFDPTPWCMPIIDSWKSGWIIGFEKKYRLPLIDSGKKWRCPGNGVAPIDVKTISRHSYLCYI